MVHPLRLCEWGEDVRDAARREFREETGLDAEIGAVCAVHSNFHNPAALTVGVWFYGRIVGGQARAGDDLDRIGWFLPEAPPEPLAFPTDRVVLADLARRPLPKARLSLPALPCAATLALPTGSSPPAAAH